MISSMAEPETSPAPISWGPEPGAAAAQDPQPGPVGDGFEVRDPDQGQTVPSTAMGPDEFHVMVQAMVSAPNGVLMLKNIDPLKSLEVASQGEGCRKASDALYETCRDVKWLNFLLAPEQVWLKRMAPIGIFVYGTYKSVRLELDERAQAKKPDLDKAPNSGPLAPVPERHEDAGAGVDQGVVELKVGGAANG